MKEICHVCKKPKKPYLVFMNNNIMSFIQYQSAREDGPICERCDRYFAMTFDKKNPSKKEFAIAVDAQKFANLMLKWWTKNKELNHEKDDSRNWEGTHDIAKWCREYLTKQEKK